eukprot:s1922_g5.t1
MALGYNMVIMAWPCPKQSDRDRTTRTGLQPPKTARADLRRTQPCLSPRQVSPAATRPVSPAVPATARLSRTNSPAQLRQVMPFATLLPRRNTEATMKTSQRSSNTSVVKAPVLRGLDVEAVSGPPLHKRSRPGDAPEQYLTPRGTCPVRFTTLAEARWAYKERVGAVQRAVEFTANMKARLEDIKDHFGSLASPSTSCGSSSDMPSELVPERIATISWTELPASFPDCRCLLEVPRNGQLRSDSGEAHV